MSHATTTRKDVTAAQPTGRLLRLRQRVPEPPSGLGRLRWWSPGLLWAVSAVGSGSVLFTPRVGSEYGYTFLWLLWGVCFLMWVMIREAGRFEVATGRTLLDGFSTLPGPRNWALWAVLLPQTLAAVAGVGGLCALVGSALAQELPGTLLVWSLVVLATALGVVVSGGYPAVSRVALVLALLLVATTVVAAARVFTPDGDARAGVVPGLRVPDTIDVPFLLPWIGTILAGSMGIVWFSYWTARRGYGGGVGDGHGAGRDEQRDVSDRLRQERLASWFGTLSHTAAVGVLTGTVVITSFLVLGTELLGPRGIVPSGTDVAAQLTRLLSEVWGTVGHFMMVAAIVVAIGGSVLANQDGWSRSFADIALILSRDGAGARRNLGHATGETRDPAPAQLPRWVQALLFWRPGTMTPRRALKILFALTFTGLFPAVVIVLVRDPVAIMSASGIVATIHTPFIVFATLAVNRRIPGDLRPGRTSTALLAFAGLFYSAFGVLYFANLLGLLP